MVAYDIENSRGTTIATINTATENTTATPLTLIGQGISLYGEKMAENMVHMLENFANTTAPANPIEGQLWYNTTVTNNKHLSVYDGVNWIGIASSTNTAMILARRLSGAFSVDMTITAIKSIATVVSTGFRFHPTAIILNPVGTITAATPPTFNLYITSSEDIMENTVVSGLVSNGSAFYPISGAKRFATTGDTVSFEITTAATGGAFTVDVYLFGFFTNNS